MNPVSHSLTWLRFRDIPPTLAALAATVFVEIGLRTLSLPRLADLVGAPLDLDVAQRPSPETTRPAHPGFTLPSAASSKLVATRRVLRRWPFGDTCLRQALVGGFLLRRFSPRLQVGVAKLEGEVRAHAWLVVSGAIIDPRRAVSSYLPLTSVPAGLDQ